MKAEEGEIMEQQLTSHGKNLVNFPQFQHEGETQVNSDFIRYNLDVSNDSRWYIANTHPMVRIRLPYVQELGEFESGPNYMTTRTHLPSFLLKITLDGEGVLRYQDCQYEIQKGEFFLIDCRQPHYYATSPKETFWKVLWIHFWGGDVSEYYRCFLEANHGCPKSTLRTPESIQIIRDLLEAYGTRPYTDYRTDMKASAFISKLLSNCVLSVLDENEKLSLQTPPRFIFEVQNYIAEHYREQISLDFLAETFYVNKFYLHKQFQRYLHTTPREFQKICASIRRRNFSECQLCPSVILPKNWGSIPPVILSRPFERPKEKRPCNTGTNGRFKDNHWVRKIPVLPAHVRWICSMIF